MTPLLLAAFLAIGLALGYGWSGAYVRAMRAEARAATAEADLERALAGSEAIMGRLVATARISERRRIERDAVRLDAEFAQMLLAVTEGERDRFETAFLATMMLQVRADELAPLDQARGEVISIERGRR